jgi:triacylglycerol esterase/lipase EstA (alpha/beta hydrolase family)
VRRGLLGRGLIGAIAAASLLAPAGAGAVTYAPVDHPGPALSVPQDTLAAGLQCSGGLATGPAPVLLVPGTGSNPQHNFSWNWEPALNNLGIPWCAVTLPDNALGDIQIAGEYVVNAIRVMHAGAGRRISIIGHSQGGMVPRWALRFWPDTRAMVDDQIGLAPSNHGTSTAHATCGNGCAPAIWQQADDAAFIKALNSYQETFPGISYTDVYTHTDEEVQPNSDDTGSSSLHGGGGAITNVAIQTICPGDMSEHNGLGTVDNTAYALAIDALANPGPANPSRIDASSVCSTPLMPGVNPATFPADASQALQDDLTNIATHPPTSTEPPLKCYVNASCANACKKHKRKKHKKGHHRAAESKKHHKKKKHRTCKKHKKHKKHQKHGAKR